MKCNAVIAAVATASTVCERKLPDIAIPLACQPFVYLSFQYVRMRSYSRIASPLFAAVRRVSSAVLHCLPIVAMKSRTN